MKTLLSIIVLGLSLTAAAGEAGACRLSGIRPLPVRGDYAAVALATVIGGDEHGADVRFDLTFDGRVAAGAARLQFGVEQREGNVVITLCQALGPRVRAGDRVVVVTMTTGEGRQRVAGWTTLTAAELEDDFFALYRAESRPAARHRLRDRWRAVNRLNGPVPLTDPARWMAPYAGSLGDRGRDGVTRVIFDIADDGRIANCEISSPHSPVALDDTLCERLGRQRRFRPPIFARERRGWYEVRWNERVGAGR